MLLTHMRTTVEGQVLELPGYRVDCEVVISNKRKGHRREVSERTLKTKDAKALKMNSEVKVNGKG